MFVDVGFGNFVELKKIITISRPDSSPIRRMMGEAKDSKRFVDLTQGKKTRSVILSHDATGTIVIGSAVQPATIIKRVECKQGVSVPMLEVIGEGGSNE